MGRNKNHPALGGSDFLRFQLRIADQGLLIKDLSLPQATLMVSISFVFRSLP
jgi:hypothetical protein